MSTQINAYDLQDANRTARHERKRRSRLREGDFWLSVFPVPASDKLNITVKSLSPQDKFKAVLFDITGRRVFDGKIEHNHLLDISKLAAGVYQLWVTNASGGVKKQRVVVE